MKLGRKQATNEKRSRMVKELHEIFNRVRGRATVKEYEQWAKGIEAAHIHINRLGVKTPTEKEFLHSCFIQFKQEVYQGLEAK